MTLWIPASDVLAWIGTDKIDLESATLLAEVASEAVSALIERDLTLQTGVTELYDTTGTPYVLLNSWPVQSVSAVSLAGQPIVPAAFQTPGWKLDRINRRKLVFVGMGNLSRAPLTLAVTYTAGYDTTQPIGGTMALPAAVWQALRLTCGAIFNSQAADPNLASESTGGVFSGSFYPTGVGAVPPGARTYLLPYMRSAP